MANVRNGNTWWVDTSSGAGTATSYISGAVRIMGVLLHVDAGSDKITLYDKDSSSAAQGAQKAIFEHDSANDTEFFDLANAPLLCPNGVWVVVTGGAKATFILSSVGG